MGEDNSLHITSLPKIECSKWLEKMLRP